MISSSKLYRKIGGIVLNSGGLNLIYDQSLGENYSGAFVRHGLVQCSFECVWIWKRVKEKKDVIV